MILGHEPISWIGGMDIFSYTICARDGEPRAGMLAKTRPSRAGTQPAFEPAMARSLDLQRLVHAVRSTFHSPL